MRAITSGLAPADCETMKVTGRCGQFCAEACGAISSVDAHATSAMVRNMMSSLAAALSGRKIVRHDRFARPIVLYRIAGQMSRWTECRDIITPWANKKCDRTLATAATAGTAMSDRRLNPISDAELDRRWKAARAMMRDRGLDALVMQNNNDWLGGYVKWFTDFPAYNGYPRTVIFHAERRHDRGRHGSADGRRGFDGQHKIHRGVGDLLTTPAFTSIAYTDGYQGELALGELKRRGYKRIGMLGRGAMPLSLRDADRARPRRQDRDRGRDRMSRRDQGDQERGGNDRGAPLRRDAGRNFRARLQEDQTRHARQRGHRARAI